MHKNTVKAWSLKGQLPDRRTPAGHRHCTDADMDRYFSVEWAPEAGRTVVHGRVSSRAQRDDLWLQLQAMETFRLGAGLAVDEWLTEIGDGLDFQRPVFRALMERIEKWEPRTGPPAGRPRGPSLPVRVGLVRVLRREPRLRDPGGQPTLPVPAGGVGRGSDGRGRQLLRPSARSAAVSEANQSCRG